jgi:SHS2 domain-containing protein
VKGATYHQTSVKGRDGAWEVRVIVDV